MAPSFLDTLGSHSLLKKSGSGEISGENVTENLLRFIIRLLRSKNGS